MTDTSSPQWIRVCQLDAIPLEGARGFDIQKRGVDDFFIVRKHELLRGYRNSCPHWPGSSLPLRKHAYLDREMNYIVCYGHGAKFTLPDGLCVMGPCLGQRLDPVEIRIEEGRYVSVKWPYAQC